MTTNEEYKYKLIIPTSLRNNNNTNKNKTNSVEHKNNSDLLFEIMDEENKGKLHILYSTFLKKYGYSSNLLIPYYDEINSKVVNMIVINNPDDVERITMKHVKKTPYLKPILYDSIISTTCVNNWSKQRKNYQPAFSVENELKKLLPNIISRAKVGVNILYNLQKYCDNEYIDIYEFFLNETMAQLQLSMFGFSNEFQEKTNKKIRNSFNGNNVEYANEFVSSLLEEIKKSNGSLSKAMLEYNKSFNSKKKEIYGNALIFPFAGHDTTANTLSWLIFEVCKNKIIYKKLQKEVDDFWLNHKDPEIEYDDLKELKYMNRCIMETLRLWTSIPNGTSRELIEDEFIIGKSGEKVKIPSGTYVQIPNWTRHRNPELWGNDVNEFNPDREFRDEEIYNNQGIGTYNPNSKRFSPFTYGPRDCIGKNFSQIEMRIILLYLIKNFIFIIPKQQIEKYNYENISFNSKTLAPRNIFNKDLYERKFGMYVKILSKNISSKI
jgi:cytochrome P450